jgi:hypothetical protein
VSWAITQKRHGHRNGNRCSDGTYRPTRGVVEFSTAVK